MWKWKKTFPNYALNLKSNKSLNTATFVEILAHLFQFNSCTHRLQAVFALNSTFPLCTAKSINITASSFSAAAVFSTRLPQWLPAMCISSKEHQHVTLTNDLQLTFQLYISNIIAEGTQVVLLK